MTNLNSDTLDHISGFHYAVLEGATMVEHDPLLDLYQIESIEVSPVDREVVGLMAKILYDIEDIENTSRNIADLFKIEQVSSEKCLSLLKTMIDSLEIELSILNLLGFNTL